MSKIWSGGVSSGEGPDLSNLMTREDNLVDKNLVEYEIVGLLAYHLELSNAQVIDKNDSKNIISALLRLLESHLTMDEIHEDVHSLVEDKVKEITDSGKNLRVFLSRNDQSHYDIRSFYMDSLLNLSMKLLEITEILNNKFSKVSGYMPGYTHYRQAMPLSIATYFDYLAGTFLQLSKESLSLYEKLAEFCPLGYGSGYGTAIKVDEKALANRLGFINSYKNPVLGASYRGMDEVDMASFESKLMISVSKLSQDFITFSSDEFGFLKLPDGYTTGSSLMPNKRNPDFLEMLQGYGSESLGILTHAVSTMMNKGLGYHREFQLSKDKVINYTQTVNEIMKALTGMVKDIEVDQVLSQMLVKNSTHATMEAYSAFSKGKPWKDAYKEVGSKLIERNEIGEYRPENFLSVKNETLEIMHKKIENKLMERKELKLELIENSKKFIS